MILKEGVKTEWFGNKLLPHLEPNRVIVLGDANWQSHVYENVPKANLYFEENYTKNVLLENLRTHKLEND